MDATTFRESAHAAIEDIIGHLTTFDRRVTPTITPGYLAPQLPTTAPFKPDDPSAILKDIQDKIKPGLTDWQHPNFFAFFPSGVSFPSILGELYSAAFNAPAFNWLCSPACTELETVVMDWVCKMLALPECYLSNGPTNGGGVIQGSASESVIVAIAAARERYIRRVLDREGFMPELPTDSEARVTSREDRACEVRSRLVVLGSEQAHSCTHKGANILGLRHRTIPAPRSSGFRVTGEALRKRIGELRAQGLEPLYLTVCLGTTSTCAVDDFEGIISVAREIAPEIWLHVDAAHAGAALICPEHRTASIMPHLDKFDSFDVNLHKWLCVNFDASCMFVRDRAHLTQGMTITPSYLQNPSNISGLVTDYRDWQIPLGRRFRALKIWWVLRSFGISGLQRLVRDHVKFAEVFAELCCGPRGKKAGIEVVAGPAYALTVIRFVAPQATLTNGHGNDTIHARTNGIARTENTANEMNDFGAGPPADAEASNALTKKIYERVNADGEFFLTSGVVDGIYTIRIVSANPNSREEALRRCFDVLVDMAESVRKEEGLKVNSRI